MVLADVQCLFVGVVGRIFSLHLVLYYLLFTRSESLDYSDTFGISRLFRHGWNALIIYILLKYFDYSHSYNI